MEPIGKLNAAIYRNLQVLINHKLQDIPILSGQSDFFFVISTKEGISQKELSRHMYVNKSTTAKAVQNLTKKGFIIKRKDKADKRMDRLYLTEAGREIAPYIRQIFAENVTVAGLGLTDAEKAQLTSLFHRVLDNLINEKQRILGENNDD